MRAMTGLLLLMLAQPAMAQTASEIVLQSDQQMRGDSAYSELSMTIVRPTWQRSMRMKSWSLGRDYALVTVIEPAKDKGNSSLKRQQQMWQWIPKVSQVIKLSSSMLSQSWMGSDFTNDDLINQSSIVIDYDHSLLSDDVVDNDRCFVVIANAKPDAPVVWSKVKLWISQDSYLQRQAEFYDEFDEVVNILTTWDVATVGGRKIATRMRMMPMDKPKQYTEIITHDAAFNFEIDAQFFSLEQLQNSH
ncbi:outer membrane lipoprotein-sorting protein [Alginatibacterium sediminis]|uniref:Outer membrane lipoprotein-sorting protein n=1 Tax=Alginatibacterium sediminis TaxID=2164068 RepID=A0A420E735_9ALTE|nr:outer membrane lipoprotein-sorting protein [Alginatibacterium sediminis]RKF13285.1 outer membrane lipoprotein-sorting protein [Alginatibacterium sediminis]